MDQSSHRSHLSSLVIQIKRNPPIWSVKAGYRYQATFIGKEARADAEAYAHAQFETFDVVAKPPIGRKQSAV